MRYSALAFALAVAIVSTAAAAATTPATTYHVVYGTKDMGGWTSMKKVWWKNGTYTNSTFDSSNGPGYETISLTRTMGAGDGSLFAALPKPNVQLVVTALNGGKIVSVTTCAVANAFSSGTTGDPGTGTTNVTFACMSNPTTKSH